LPQHSPVEYAITTRYLERYIAAGATVADVGVGGGYYAELLARRGCSLFLVDVSERLLDATVSRLRAAGLHERILGVSRTSATRLDHLAPTSCDAVLYLGPLYHLTALEERVQAIREAARVLKRKGIFFGAAINRMAYLRDAFRNRPDRGAERLAARRRFLQDGNLTPEMAPPLGFAHLSTVEEFHGLCATAFGELALVGIDSFAQVSQTLLLGLSDENVDAWLELVEQVGLTPEGLGMSDHFLYIGRPKP
jgi:SAM-dependent methyltransferase